MSDWFFRLSKLAAPVAATLLAKGWTVRFGGSDSNLADPKTPQLARSAFLQNRAMGDWAEALAYSALVDAGLAVTHYGASDDIQAGDDGFPLFFKEQIAAVRQQGKRPDLLVADAGTVLPQRIDRLGAAERDAYLEQCFAAIEVRSSKYKALQYIRVKAERKANKARSVGQLSPNFTVKVEDLVILYRWVELHLLPQAYLQIFFDSAFAINVLRIFELIAEWPKDLDLVKPTRSQDKPTIFIPITYGKQVGDMQAMPTFHAQTRESPLGQVEAYVVPLGGKLVIDRNLLLGILRGQAVSQPGNG